MAAVIDISQGIVELLKQSTQIVSLCGERISADQIPQTDQTPSLLVWAPRENALDAIDGPLGMDQPTVRVECYADRRQAANSLRLLVRDHIGGYKGVVARIFIKGIAQQSGQVHSADRVRLGTDQYRFRCYQDFLVTYDSQD